MKWNHKLNLQKCLEDARNEYTTLLSESDIDPNQMDEAESNFNQSLADEGYDSSWMIAQELAQFTPIHTTSFDEHEDKSRYFGAIVIIEDKQKGKSLVLDGNHRFNTVINKYPKMQIFVIRIEGFLP